MVEKLIEAFSPGIAALLVGLVGAWFAARASKKAGDAANEAKALTATTQEMSSRLDGKLDELKKLWQSEADAGGYARATEDARIAAEIVAEQTKIDRQIDREESKADRAEGAASNTSGTSNAGEPQEVTVVNPEPLPVDVVKPAEPKDK